MNKLPLELAYTFKTGEKLFTYREEDLGKISSRYYRQINEAINYIQTFSVTKSQWDSAVEVISERIKDALDGGDKTKCLLDINSTFDYFNKQMSDNKNATQIMLESLFCMFYLLEDEQEGGYSELHNARKIALLNSEDEYIRDFFLQSLKAVTDSLGITSEQDTLMLLMKLQKEQAESKAFLHLLNLQTPPTT